MNRHREQFQEESNKVEKLYNFLINKTYKGQFLTEKEN